MLGMLELLFPMITQMYEHNRVEFILFYISENWAIIGTEILFDIECSIESPTGYWQ